MPVWAIPSRPTRATQIDPTFAYGHYYAGLAYSKVRRADRMATLDKVVRALQAPSRVVHVVYEAGPCGFGLHRHLTGPGLDCVVVSPSMVPKRSGDRVKTDRRDRVTLARRHRAGERRAIHMPEATDEAMRDRVRAREDAVVVATRFPL